MDEDVSDSGSDSEYSLSKRKINDLGSDDGENYGNKRPRYPMLYEIIAEDKIGTETAVVGLLHAYIEKEKDNDLTYENFGKDLEDLIADGYNINGECSISDLGLSLPHVHCKTLKGNALHYLAIRDSKYTNHYARVLIDHCADIHTKNSSDQDLFDSILLNSEKNPLLGFILAEDREYIKVDERIILRKYTPIHYVVEFLKDSHLQVLLQYVADVNRPGQKDVYDFIAINARVDYDNYPKLVECIRLLKGKMEWTPQNLLNAARNPLCIKAFLDNRADPNTNVEQKSLLELVMYNLLTNEHLNITYSRYACETVAVLLQYGAEVPGSLREKHVDIHLRPRFLFEAKQLVRRFACWLLSLASSSITITDAMIRENMEYAIGFYLVESLRYLMITLGLNIARYFHIAIKTFTIYKNPEKNMKTREMLKLLFENGLNARNFEIDDCYDGDDYCYDEEVVEDPYTFVANMETRYKDNMIRHMSFLNRFERECGIKIRSRSLATI